MFQVAVVGHVDRDGPVFFFDELLNIRDAVGDDVVEHEGVETRDALLGAQQHLVAHHEENQLEEDPKV